MVVNLGSDCGEGGIFPPQHGDKHQLERSPLLRVSRGAARWVTIATRVCGAGYMDTARNRHILASRRMLHFGTWGGRFLDLVIRWGADGIPGKGPCGADGFSQRGHASEGGSAVFRLMGGVFYPQEGVFGRGQCPYA